MQTDKTYPFRSYMHFRRYTANISRKAARPEILPTQGMMLSPTGGCTFAFDLKVDHEGNPFLEFSAAVCSDKDHYNKKLGRAIAAGRLAKGDSVRVDGVATVRDARRYFADLRERYAR